MMRKTAILVASSALAVAVMAGPNVASALVVTPTTDSTALLNALVPNQSQFNSISAAYTYGDPAQVGTYTGFTSPPVTIGNGVVLSTGNAIDVVGPPIPAGNGDLPATSIADPPTATAGGSTPEINAYSPTHVTGWGSSFDAAVLTVNFNLANPSAIAFRFVFGSIEYPNWVNLFADGAYAFLDGNQIIFDSNGNTVEVGSSFVTLLTTADTNTVFADTHGTLGPLITTSGTLLAGDHTLLFEVADTNDHILDSAIFLSDLHTTTNSGGPVTELEDVPEPASLPMLAVGLVALGFISTRRKAA